eukprot:GHVL01015030.1.p1 GENE.GHVL01015030.1~~GHVL01015030.1.p1  ORF type:complete len:187 (+),score=64.54 GHVL01015030.1:54-614(+)
MQNRFRRASLNIILKNDILEYSCRRGGESRYRAFSLDIERDKKYLSAERYLPSKKEVLRSLNKVKYEKSKNIRAAAAAKILTNKNIENNKKIKSDKKIESDEDVIRAAISGDPNAMIDNVDFLDYFETDDPLVVADEFLKIARGQTDGYIENLNYEYLPTPPVLPPFYIINELRIRGYEGPIIEIK